MTVRDEQFRIWCSELMTILRTGYGFTQKEADAYVEKQPEVWRDFFDDEYTPRQAAAEDAAAGL